MFQTIKYSLLPLSVLLSGNIVAQVPCPPKTGIQKKDLFDRIFGGGNFYCMNDVKAAAIQDEKIIGKWEVVKAKRKTRNYEGRYHKQTKVYHYRGEIDGIRSIQFRNDRTTTFAGDSAVKHRLENIYWAYLKPSEKLRGYDPEIESDSSAYDLKGQGCIFQFKLNERGYLEAYPPTFEVRKLTKNKLILGTVRGKDSLYGTEVVLRRLN